MPWGGCWCCSRRDGRPVLVAVCWCLGLGMGKYPSVAQQSIIIIPSLIPNPNVPSRRWTTPGAAAACAAATRGSRAARAPTPLPLVIVAVSRCVSDERDGGWAATYRRLEAEASVVDGRCRVRSNIIISIGPPIWCGVICVWIRSTLAGGQWRAIHSCVAWVVCLVRCGPLGTRSLQRRERRKPTHR